jgi:hypothetical protein
MSTTGTASWSARWKARRSSGLRYCVNSESLVFVERKDLAQLADPAAAGRTY